ncbi:hypothetical protein ACQP1O_10715 [Nocardia sp. CA-151230]|uniref:hypothetical protein n=1 Tax=Nocardia sp. CA-151230 TaxID=3239982 RepID=UPI003D8FD7E0
MSMPEDVSGSQSEPTEDAIEVSFVVRQDSLRIKYWADDSTSDILWDDLSTRTKRLGNGAFIDDDMGLTGPPEPVMELTALVLGTLGAGGAVKMLVEILRDWVARYRIKGLLVDLPDGTRIQMADTSIESVERFLAAIDAHRDETATPAPLSAPDTAREVVDGGEAASSE